MELLKIVLNKIKRFVMLRCHDGKCAFEVICSNPYFVLTLGIKGIAYVVFERSFLEESILLMQNDFYKFEMNICDLWELIPYHLDPKFESYAFFFEKLIRSLSMCISVRKM